MCLVDLKSSVWILKRGFCFYSGHFHLISFKFISNISHNIANLQLTFWHCLEKNERIMWFTIRSESLAWLILAVSHRLTHLYCSPSGLWSGIRGPSGRAEQETSDRWSLRSCGCKYGNKTRQHAAVREESLSSWDYCLQYASLPLNHSQLSRYKYFLRSLCYLPF